MRNRGIAVGVGPHHLIMEMDWIPLAQPCQWLSQKSYHDTCQISQEQGSPSSSIGHLHGDREGQGQVEARLGFGPGSVGPMARQGWAMRS